MVEFVILIHIVAFDHNEKLKPQIWKSTALNSYHRYRSIKYATEKNSQKKGRISFCYSIKQVSFLFSPYAKFYIKKYWWKEQVILVLIQVYSGSFLIRFGLTAVPIARSRSGSNHHIMLTTSSWAKVYGKEIAASLFQQTTGCVFPDLKHSWSKCVRRPKEA